MIENEWSFFSNYAHVLVCLAQNPSALLREIADKVGVTERTAMRLINQLDRAGILERVKQGRRNTYRITAGEHLRHPLEAHCTIEEMLKPILQNGEKSAATMAANTTAHSDHPPTVDSTTPKTTRESTK